MDSFIDSEVENIFWGYGRDLLYSQPEAIEVWVGMDSLSRIVTNAARKLCAPVIIARGYASVSFKHDCRLRVEANGEQGKNTHILYFGDMDPSGVDMLPSMLSTLKEDMGLGEYVDGTHCALTLNQVRKYNLPVDPDAVKSTDVRTPEYRRLYGNIAVELDALRSDILGGLVTDAIEQRLDMNLMEADRAGEEDDRRRVNEVRERIQAPFKWFNLLFSQ